MKVNFWRFVFYDGPTGSVVKDELNNFGARSRLKRLTWDAFPAPGSVNEDGSTVAGDPISGALELVVSDFVNAQFLDRCEVYLGSVEDALDLVWGGVVSALPPLRSDDGSLSLRAEGNYRTARRVFDRLEIGYAIDTFPQPLFSKVRDVIQSAFPDLTVADLGGNSLGSVADWRVSEETLKLDAFCRTVDTVIGGDLVYGFRNDGQFVLGRRPVYPMRVLDGSEISFEPRSAPVANTLIGTTGVDLVPTIKVKEPGADAWPIEEVEDVSSLVRRSPLSPEAFYHAGSGMDHQWYDFIISYPVGAPLGAHIAARLKWRPNGLSSRKPTVTFRLCFYDESTYFGGSGTPTFVQLRTVNASSSRLVNNTETHYDFPEVEFEASALLTVAATRMRLEAVTAPLGEIGFTANFGEDPSTVELSDLTTYEFDQARAALEVLIAQKYGPTLNASVMLPQAYERVGGTCALRYVNPLGVESQVFLTDQSATYTLENGTFSTVIKAGSKTRLTVAQRARVEIERANSRITRGITTPVLRGLIG